MNTITDFWSVMQYSRIRSGTIWRLPAYLRGAMHLFHDGIKRVPGKDFARLLGVNPWQLREDFSHFGDFGSLGVGYALCGLIRRINNILSLYAGHRAALAGIGAILNLSPRYVTVPKRVKVVTIDIAMELARLPYSISAG